MGIINSNHENELKIMRKELLIAKKELAYWQERTIVAEKKAEEAESYGHFMSFTRTFHSVGQGAFYTEIFDLHDKDFVVVYDCGSETYISNLSDFFSIKSKFKNLIRDSVFNDNRYHYNPIDQSVDFSIEVDVLIISHFHRDHINGIKHLRPKIVICPFIEKGYFIDV
ncbi:MAG: hypothetical protein K2G52_03685 [Muribaculaceae bacterium]|nr:hypothetical protein [Muribaculaceae bacterium]